MVQQAPKGGRSPESFSVNNTIDRLLGDEGILTPYIVGFDGIVPKISDRMPSEDGKVIYIELTSLNFIQLPSRGIEDGIVYECKIGGESEPRFRFRLGKNRKLRQNKLSKKIQHSDEHLDGDLVDQVDTRSAFYRPKSIIITESIEQTLGKREGVIGKVKEIAGKLTKK